MTKIVTKPEIEKCLCPNCTKEILPIILETKQIDNPRYKNHPIGRIPQMNLWILGCPECNIIFFKEFHYIQA